LNPANLLVLDEPTNDLDMATLNVLEECLIDFSGAVILVTHDRYFLDQVANRILAFSPADSGTGEINFFADLTQWEDWHKEQMKIRKNRSSSNSSKGGSAKSDQKRKLSFKEIRELESMESNIEKLESTLTRLAVESSLPENASNATVLTKLSQEMATTQAEIDRLYSRWSELTSLST
jgi:ATP-binding cassette subfamily F protein uup